MLVTSWWWQTYCFDMLMTFAMSKVTRQHLKSVNNILTSPLTKTVSNIKIWVLTYGSADDSPRKIKHIIYLSIIFIKLCLNYQIQILGLGFSWSYKGLPSWNAWIFYSHSSINTREWVQNKQLKSVFTVLIYR